ncbi:MAG: hypothetical protein ACI9VR_002914 [Cognaticolwellia sp.]|jgi:hypothetical protein
MKMLSWVSLLGVLSLTACDLCAGEGCDEESDGCVALNADGCEVDPRCTELLAQPLVGENADDWCTPANLLNEFVGCIDSDEVCDDAMTIALDEEDQAWEFPNSCIPEDWEEVPWFELSTCE